jgi:hypothetical protein
MIAFMRKLLCLFPAFAFFSLAGCTSSAKTAENVLVRIGYDICKEENVPTASGWVQLVCTIEQGVAHVLLPSGQWEAIKAAHAPVPAVVK